MRKFAAGLWAIVLAVAPAGSAERAVTLAPVPASVNVAPIALLVDLSAGQTLYARNAERRFLPASMTKTMSALVAFDLIAAGKLRLDDVVIVSPAIAARWAGKGTTLSLRSGEVVSVAQLIEGMITVSANDATEALAAHATGSRDAWIALMNARAQALGMDDSRFASPTGLPDGGRTVLSARDAVRLARALIDDHPELYRRFFGHHAMIWRGVPLLSRNPFAGRVAGADGIKTGHTREAGFTFMGSAERDGRRLVLVVGGVPSEAARASAATDLLEWGYAAWDSRPLVRAGQIVGAARVQNGTRRQVGLAPLKPWRIALPRGTSPQIRTRLVYRGPLPAPLRKGTVVAGLEVTINGQPAHDLPLATTSDVVVAGPFDRVANGLLGLLP